jgi:hypothetical protein
MSETFNYNTVYNTISATTLTAANLGGSNVSAANIVVSGNLSVAGTLTTVNLTTTSLIDTNVTAGNANITNATIGTARITSNLIGMNGTLGSLFTTGGNIGVGTTSPLSKLNVQGDASGIYPSDWAQVIISGASDSRKRLGLMMDTTNNVGLIGAGLNGTGTYNLCLGAGSSGSPASSVGINTTSPAQTLDVNGTSRINNNLMFSSASNNNLGINFPNTGYGIHWGSGYSRIYDDVNLRICTDDIMYFHTGSTTSTSGATRITMLQNGNVGIGITSPNVNLEVAGSVRIGNNGTNNKTIVLYDNNTGDAISNATNFLGFGINNGTLRYQVPSDQMHKFYNAGDLGFQLNHTGQTIALIPAADGNNKTDWPNWDGGIATWDICCTAITLAYGVTQRSDVRKKQDIVDYSRGLTEVLQMRPVSFRLKEHLNYGTQYGFIAQEMEEIVPELINEDTGGFKSITNAYPSIFANAIKELKQKLDTARSRLDQLKLQKADI